LQVTHFVLAFLLKPAPGPSACSVKALTLRSDEREKHAALTARTATRLAPPRKGIAFYAPLSAVPLRSKNKTNERSFPMQEISKQPAFDLGQIVATPGALAVLEKAGQGPGEFLTRHSNREWGDLSDEDRKENNYSLGHGFRLVSSYRTNAGDKLLIITESDRTVTTLLLPQEY
jgi:hypothetical protein